MSDTTYFYKSIRSSASSPASDTSDCHHRSIRSGAPSPSPIHIANAHASQRYPYPTPPATPQPMSGNTNTNTYLAYSGLGGPSSIGLGSLPLRPGIYHPQTSSRSTLGSTTSRSSSIGSQGSSSPNTAAPVTVAQPQNVDTYPAYSGLGGPASVGFGSALLGVGGQREETSLRHGVTQGSAASRSRWKG